MESLYFFTVCENTKRKYSKKKILRINGSRTTKYKTLEEKIKFLSENKDDVYYCLARNKKEWKDGLRKYYLFIFKSDISANFPPLNPVMDTV